MANRQQGAGKVVAGARKGGGMEKSRAWLSNHGSGLETKPVEVLFHHPAIFLPVAFTGQRRFQAALLPRRNIEGVSFDFTNDVFLLNFALETAQGAFQGFVISQADLCQD